MGKLYVCATPVGNMSDVSKRLIETLNQVDYILVEDTRRTIKLLNHYEIKKKMISYHKFNEKERSGNVIQDLKDGKNIALVGDAGTPCISDPGYEVVKQARENEIEVIAIPGPSAVISALSISGFELSSFSFYGFLPRETSKQEKALIDIKNNGIDTFVIYESPNRIIKTLENTQNIFKNAIVLVASDLTKVHEKSIYGPIEQVTNTLKEDEKSNLGEYAIVINKNEKQEEIQNDLSLEALLFDTAVKNKCSIKAAITILNRDSDYSKTDLYNASLNIKEIMNKRN